MMQAIRSTRYGGDIGFVGVPHDVDLPGEEFFYAEVHTLGLLRGCFSRRFSPNDAAG